MTPIKLSYTDYQIAYKPTLFSDGNKNRTTARIKALNHAGTLPALAKSQMSKLAACASRLSAHLGRGLVRMQQADQGVHMRETTPPKDIDEYIAAFPESIQLILEDIRATIRKAAPEAKETIAYRIPTFTLEGNLVHFAAFKTHIGFYPTPTGIEKFEKELSIYQSAKGSVKFPLDKPIPLALIDEIVRFRVGENLESARTHRTNKPTK